MMNYTQALKIITVIGCIGGVIALYQLVKRKQGHQPIQEKCEDQKMVVVVSPPPRVHYDST